MVYNIFKHYSYSFFLKKKLVVETMVDFYLKNNASN